MRNVRLALVAALLTACGDDVSVLAERADGAGGPGPALAAMTREAAPAHDARVSQTPVPASAAAAPQSAFSAQKLIRTAEVNVEVDSVERAIQHIDSIARQRDAMIADVRLSNDARDANAQLVIRVPATQFAALMSSLAAVGSVRNQVITTEDVTKAYADLETRLAVKEQTVARLRNLLATRTGQLDDVLNVEHELARVVTEMEQMKGERQYYDQRIAVSTITISLFESAVYTRAGFWVSISNAFSSSISVLSTSVSWLIYLVTFLTPWAAIAAIGWFVTKRLRIPRRSM